MIWLWRKVSWVRKGEGEVKGLRNKDAGTVGKNMNVNDPAIICDVEWKILEGKLVLVGDDEILLKSLNADQPTIMEPFPCF